MKLNSNSKSERNPGKTAWPKGKFFEKFKTEEDENDNSVSETELAVRGQVLLKAPKDQMPTNILNKSADIVLNKKLEPGYRHYQQEPADLVVESRYHHEQNPHGSGYNPKSRQQLTIQGQLSPIKYTTSQGNPPQSSPGSNLVKN